MEEKLNHIYIDLFHYKMGEFGSLLPNNHWPKWPIRVFGIGIHALKTARDVFQYGSKTIVNCHYSPGKIWLLIGTRNNRDTLLFLKEELGDDAIFMATNKKVLRLEPTCRLSMHRQFFWWPRAFRLARNLYSFYKKMFFKNIDHFFELVGYYEAACQMLEEQRPRLMIFSNDHAPENRALIWAAKTTGIPTVYIQHASVTAYFPSLKFDLSLLEGQDTLEKYQKSGTVEGEVRFIGMPKFDRFFHLRNYSKTVRRIGVCASVLDDQQKIKSLLLVLKDTFPGFHISFRPHPRDERTFDLPPNIDFSNPDKEGIFDFLCRQDLMIAGDTSTHIEAILLNVISIYYPLYPSFDDNYGYVQNGLIDRIDSTQDLISKIQKIKDHRPEVYQRARHYNAVVGTENEGKSSALAIQFIRAFLEDRSENSSA